MNNVEYFNLRRRGLLLFKTHFEITSVHNKQIKSKLLQRVDLKIN